MIRAAKEGNAARAGSVRTHLTWACGSVCVGGGLVGAPDVARHDAGRESAPGLQVWYHVTWKVGFCNFSGFSSPFLPQSGGVLGPLSFIVPYPSLTDWNLKNKLFSGQR